MNKFIFPKLNFILLKKLVNFASINELFIIKEIEFSKS